MAESFIVTQDPMENTIADFWRMVFDQEVTTIVMLSEVSDHCLGGKKGFIVFLTVFSPLRDSSFYVFRF